MVSSVHAISQNIHRADQTVEPVVSGVSAPDSFYIAQNNSTTPQTPAVANASKGEVLVVLSAADYLELKEKDAYGRSLRYSTGYFLNELAIPLMKIIEAGYAPVFATPGGIAPTMDKGSASPNFFNNSQNDLDKAFNFIAAQDGMKRPVSLSDISGDPEQMDRFVGMFIPGGHAPMQDLYNNEDLGKIHLYFHKNKKITAEICHGPAALLSAKNGKGWAYAGYKMTAYSDDAEKYGEAQGWLGGHVKWHLGSALQAGGAIIVNAGNWDSNVIVDRELITGQNPQSDAIFADTVVKALDTYVEPTEFTFPNGSRLKAKDREEDAFKKELSGLKTWIRETIGSGDISKFKGKIGPGKAYSIIGRPFDLRSGPTTFFIGTRKKGTRPDKFLTKLADHVKDVARAFEPMGLKGYIVLASDDYELAVMNWESREKMKAAFDSKIGKDVVEDANSFMNGLSWEDL